MSQINDNDNGWIALHRKLQDHQFWKEPRKFSKAEAWIDLLWEAQHTDTTISHVRGFQVLTTTRGQSIKTLSTWAMRWGWGISTVRRYLDMLQQMKMIRKENVTKTTRITICNYDTYQNLRRPNELEEASNRIPIKFKEATDNKENNDNNDKQRDKKASTFKTWTSEEFKQDMRRANKPNILTSDQLYSFFDYWIEPDKNGKPRRALQQTWSTRGRMQTWARNAKSGKFGNASEEADKTHVGTYEAKGR